MSQITFTLDFRNPILVSDLSDSLASIADEYSRTKSLQERPDEDAYDVYVTEVAKGSIIAVIQEWGPYAIPVAEGYNTIHDLVKNWAESFAWLKSKLGKKPELDPEQLENTIRLVKPATHDTGAIINVTGNTVHGNVTINVNYAEARTVTENARLELDEMGRTRLQVMEKKVLRWFQARNDPKSKSGDRAIIDELYPKSVKTTFLNEGLKAKLISGAENPFRHQYIVDVAVELIGARPVAYRITEIHGAV